MSTITTIATKTWAKCAAILQAWTNNLDVIANVNDRSQFIHCCRWDVRFIHHRPNCIQKARRYTYMVSPKWILQRLFCFSSFLFYFVACPNQLTRVNQSIFLSDKLIEDFKHPMHVFRNAMYTCPMWLTSSSASPQSFYFYIQI